MKKCSTWNTCELLRVMFHVEQFFHSLQKIFPVKHEDF